MPLSRYEIRSEYSLANPDLYRAADKDDPEGLLEGVAMAGLVGIIRQLGDLAEFAAEVFHDLHEDVLALAARGHELFERLQHLETEVPSIEKMMLTKVDNRNCFYNQGLEWHVHIHNDQNHFTQGDLPRFIRSAYEDCRSPPRLFTLDRYDVAGAGSCLKRFTDPSFFKMEWASSELMKAEKEQRDRKARKIKRKGERQANGAAREAKIASQIQFRMPNEVDNTETLRSPSSASDSSLDSLMQRAVDSLENDVRLASGMLVSEQRGLQSKTSAVEDFRVEELPQTSLDMKMEKPTLDMARHMDVVALKDLKNDIGVGEVVVDDSASETDNFVDAVTTIDSEVETDSEMKTRAEVKGVFSGGIKEMKAPAPAFELQNGVVDKQDEVDGLDKQNEVDGELLVEFEEVEAPAPALLQLQRGTNDEDDVTKEDENCSIIEEDEEVFVLDEDKQSLVIEEDIASEKDNESLVTEEDKGGLAIEEDKEGTVLEEDIASQEDKEGRLTEDGKRGLVIEEDITSEKGVTEDKEGRLTEDGKRGLVIEEDITSEKGEEGLVIEEDIANEDSSDTEHAHFVSNSPKVSAEEEDGSFLHSSFVAPSGQDNDVSSTPNSGCGTFSPVLGEDTITISEAYVIENTPTVFAKEEDLSSVDKSYVGLSARDKVSASISQSNASSLGFEDVAVLDAEGHFQSGNTIVLETPEALEADNVESLPEKNVSDNFYCGQVEDRPQSKSSKALGGVTTRKRWQISNLFSKEILASDLERDSLQASEGELSESPTKQSLQSSPSSSIQPMKWAVDLSRSYHTDDDIEGMQISSASPSSSSSTLSSPRPSTLATTLRHMSLEHMPQKLVDLSPRSHSLKSGIKTTPSQSVLQVKTTSEPLMSSDLGCSAHSSPHSSSSAEQPFFDPLPSFPSLAFNVNTSSSESPTKKLSAQSLAATNLEIFPPPPPLPPLAWRMTRRMRNTVMNPLRPMESPASIPIPFGVRVLPDELSQAFTSSTTLPNVPSNVELNEPTYAFSSPIIGKPISQKSGGMLKESIESSMYETGLSDLDTLHERSDDLSEVSKPVKSHDRGPALANLDTVEQDTASALATADAEGQNITTAGPGVQHKLIDDNTCVILPHVLRTGSIPARLDEVRIGLQSESAVDYQSLAPQRNELPNLLARSLERKVSTEATTSDDTSGLKRRSKWALTSSTASSDDREVLLDQIRTRSFSLRNTSRDKLVPSRPVTNINVAAILEKANAIRQAFAGSDDDNEEWSDA